MTTQQKKNPHAAALGRLGRGKPKRFSPEELERRRKRTAEARKFRWAKQDKPK